MEVPREKDGMQVPKATLGSKYNIMVVGPANVGKTSLIQSFFVVTGLDPSISPLTISTDGNHGTNYTTPVSIPKTDVIVTDTPGVLIPYTELLHTWKAPDTNESKICNPEFLKLLNNISFFEEKMIEQNWSTVPYPQLVLVVVPATIFLKMIKVGENVAVDSDDLDFRNYNEASFATACRLCLTVKSKHMLHQIINMRYLVYLWIQKLKTVSNIQIRLILTKIDQVPEKDVSDMLEKAASISGLSKLQINVIQNYTSECKPEVDSQIKEKVSVLLNILLSLITIRGIQPATDGDFELISANYCLADNPQRYYPKLVELNQLLKDQSIKFGKKELHIDTGCYSKLLGDPFPKRFGSNPKMLVIQYRYRGRVEKITVKEQESLHLPVRQ